MLLTVPAPTRALLVRVLDGSEQPIEGALVRFYVNNRMRVEGQSQIDRPLKFEISVNVDTIDVEVIFGPFHQWYKVPMDAGTYPIKIGNPMDQPSPPQPPDPPSRSGLAPAVLVAIITGVVALITAYWQFVYKQSHAGDDGNFAIRVLVEDDSNHSPISHSKVSVLDGSKIIEGQTDETGYTGGLKISKSGSSTLEVRVAANGYKPITRNLDRPTADAPYTIGLVRVANSGVPADQVVHATISGTWQVEAPADPSSARITSGTFTFVPQGNGSIAVSGRLHLDGTTVTLTGTGGSQGRQKYITFSARTDEGGSWKGTADLTQVSAKRITGSLQSKGGDEVGFVLTIP
jgi:hypothetical protein